MNLDNLILEKLTQAGIQAEEVTVVKNSVLCKAIRVITGNSIDPVVYYSQDESLESLYARIRQAMESLPSFDAELLKNADYLKANLRMAVQKKSDESIIKADYLNLEAFMRVRITGEPIEGCIKVNKALLDLVGLSEEEAWSIAKRNTLSDIRVRSMAEILPFPESEPSLSPLWVVDVPAGDGAAAILFPEIFQNFCLAQSVKSCLILPSSTEEVLALPEHDDSFPYSELARMVADVNASEVDPRIRLYSVLYRYTLTDNAIAIVAEAEV